MQIQAYEVTQEHMIHLSSNLILFVSLQLTKSLHISLLIFI
jgi:hypothetical protein